ncbi:MAG: cell division protein FtsA, partial [Bacteroidetes bacterium]|nr:cell division protein FtsA [Bacteroidota bacterium]
VDILINDMYKIPIEAGEEIIHVLPQSYIVDNEVGVKNPIGMFGKRLEANFHIVIGQIASANNIKKCVNRCSLEVNSLVLEPLASSAAVLTEDEKEVGVALVDIGGGTTDIAVYHDDIIRHTAVIPFGGNVVTNDIKEGCAILERQAEALKIQFGSALAEMAGEDEVVTVPGISGREPKEISFKSLAFIIQSRMEEIIGAIYFEIESSGFLEKLGAGIVITGGGALLRHLPQLVAFKTGLDVRIGYPSEFLRGDIKDEVNQTMYATSVGLILKGYEETENQWFDEFRQSDIENDADADIQDEDKPPVKNEPRVKPFDGLLKKFGDFFEEKDAKL